MDRIYRFLSFFFLVFIKIVSRLLFTFKVNWPGGNRNLVDFKKVRLIVLLNHTSLLEPLFVGILPISFLYQLSRKMAAPGADKTLNRPLVGTLYKMFSPGMKSITRKRDDSWDEFMNSIEEDSVIVIIPEGRMKRRNGFDLQGNKMTVKSGVADILARLDGGKMLIACSGGLHHVHAPGEKRYRFFQTLKLNVFEFDIASYDALFEGERGSEAWVKSVVADMQYRLENDCPQES